MSIYDPAIYRTVVAENGGVDRKYHSVNKLLIDMAAAGMIDIHVGDNPPSDTEIVWLDLTLPENGNGQAKVYDGSSWVTLTPEYFVFHYGASTAAAEAAAAEAAASAAEAEGYKDQTVADAVSTAADVVSSEAAKTAAVLAMLAAEQARNEAEIAADNFDDVYLGSKSSDPTQDNDGNALVEGQLYWNNASNALRIYDGALWQAYSAASGITSVAEDTTPQLGGNLDLNGFDITGAGNVSVIDVPYGVGWNGSTQAPTQNAVYDKVETLQPLDSDLTAIAALTPSNDDIMQRKAGAWINRTIAQLLTDLGLGAIYQPLAAALTSWAGVTRAAGFDTFAVTPSSANLAALVTNETGSGALVFGTSPALTTPNLGTPSAVNLTNGTALPVAGITASTVTALGVGSLELGHATDTSITRVSAGRPAVESNLILLNNTAGQGPIIGGAYITPNALGTVSSGTTTVNVSDRALASYTNNGAHTLAPGTGGTGSCVLLITNGASAGAITTSSFDAVFGDSFDTVNGSVFRCVVERWGASNEYLFVRKLV